MDEIWKPFRSICISVSFTYIIYKRYPTFYLNFCFRPQVFQMDLHQIKQRWNLSDAMKGIKRRRKDSWFKCPKMAAIYECKIIKTYYTTLVFLQCNQTRQTIKRQSFLFAEVPFPGSLYSVIWCRNIHVHW